MLNEKFVESIAATAVKASGASILRLEDDPRNAFLVQDGKHTNITLRPAPRNHSLLTLDDVAEAAGHWEADLCFHDEREIVLILDDQDRHDRATMGLGRAPQWDEFCAMTKPRTFNHKQLLALLRITFRGCVDATFVSRIRGINFNAIADGESYIQPGAEKVGKSIQNKVAMQSGGDIPEEVPLSIPVYVNHGLTQRFATVLALDIDAASQTFTVTTPPGEVETIQNAITEHIHQTLEGRLKCTVLRGSP